MTKVSVWIAFLKKESSENGLLFLLKRRKNKEFRFTAIKRAGEFHSKVSSVIIHLHFGNLEHLREREKLRKNAITRVLFPSQSSIGFCPLWVLGKLNSDLTRRSGCVTNNFLEL